MRKTAKPVDSSKAVDSTSDTGVSFEFGLSRVTSMELDEFAKVGWFPRNLVRPSEGEVVPDPHSDELVVFKEFFYSGVEVSSTSSCDWGSDMSWGPDLHDIGSITR